MARTLSLSRKLSRTGLALLLVALVSIGLTLWVSLAAGRWRSGGERILAGQADTEGIELDGASTPLLQ